GSAWKEFFEDFRPKLESPGDGQGGKTEPTGREPASLRPASPRPTPASAMSAPISEALPSVTAPAPSEAPPSADASPLRTGDEQQSPAAQAGVPPTQIPPEGAERIRFGAERIVKNMERSLQIPTATSFRFVPAKA